MTAVYVAHVRSAGIEAMAGSSLDEAYRNAHQGIQSPAVLQGAMQAFEASFTAVSGVVIALLFLLPWSFWC